VTRTYRTNRLIRTWRARGRSISTRTINSSARCKWSDETRINAFSTTHLPTSTDTHETLPTTFLSRYMDLYTVPELTSDLGLPIRSDDTTRR
jgi:hypothetical protein